MTISSSNRAELEREIQETEVTYAQLDAARAFLAKFAFTATALTALYLVVSEEAGDCGGDCEDAALLLSAANEMVEVEARLV